MLPGKDRAERGKSVQALLPKLLEEHKLIDRSTGTKKAEDAWVDQLSQTIFASTPEQAAGAVASALAEGIDPKAVGEAISLAANQESARFARCRTHRGNVETRKTGWQRAWRFDWSACQ